MIQQTLRVYAQHWVQERILKEQSGGLISREVKFSDKSQKKIVPRTHTIIPAVRSPNDMTDLGS